MTERHEEPMELTFLGTTSVGGNCPNAYETSRGTFVVQGTRITDPTALRQLHERGMPQWETAVEIPKGLIAFFRQDG